ncbi:hypothetical protein JTE90_007513 [Oedothorax gibbosus]|uniref:Uncharacterized protein n=1 Tax=Oedothorax gibbosus TaxID=931172 RepID=A0AAV6VKB9_9ARAC|nr:hypothetical protein JTE90_007513 [Oedothorax gibbosus]
MQQIFATKPNNFILYNILKICKSSTLPTAKHASMSTQEHPLVYYGCVRKPDMHRLHSYFCTMHAPQPLPLELTLQGPGAKREAPTKDSQFRGNQLEAPATPLNESPFHNEMLNEAFRLYPPPTTLQSQDTISTLPPLHDGLVLMNSIVAFVGTPTPSLNFKVPSLETSEVCCAQDAKGLFH